jgi:hypothetical protein
MEAYVAPKTILNWHGLLIVNENKSAEFSSTAESIRLLNRLYCASKKDNKNSQLRFRRSQFRSFHGSSGRPSQTSRRNLSSHILNYLQLTTETFSIANGRRNKLWTVQST